jgi:hypothetical protein
VNLPGCPEALLHRKSYGTLPGESALRESSLRLPTSFRWDIGRRATLVPVLFLRGHSRGGLR